MATYSNYLLRMPASLTDDVRCAAERDGVSMNDFIIEAVAEKVGALRELDEAEQMTYINPR